MPRPDPQSFWGLVADLWRELSWIMRLCGTIGLIAGLAFALWLTGHLWRDTRFGFFRVLVLIVIGLTIAGGTLGLGIGAIIELFMKKGPPDGLRRW